MTPPHITPEQAREAMNCATFAYWYKNARDCLLTFISQQEQALAAERRKTLEEAMRIVGSGLF